MSKTNLFTALTAAGLFVLYAGAASAAPLTLKIDYSGIVPNAENEISSFTFENGTASFEHPLSNISPQLFQMTALGTPVADLTVTAYDGTADLGSFDFEHVLFTSVMLQNLVERVSFAFPASAGFYSVDYPGIVPNAENEISSVTLTPTSVSFEHPISNISPQLLSLTASGTPVSQVTFTQSAGPFFGNLALDHAIFTSVTHPSGSDPLENVSLAFAGFDITTPTAVPVPEPSSLLLLVGGLAAIISARRTESKKAELRRS